MKATITLQQIWFNSTLIYFFFRKRAKGTLEELIQQVGANDSEAEFKDLEDRIEEAYGGDLDLFEEDCYARPVEVLLDILGYDNKN